MARNVHKDDFNRIRLPQEAISEDRGLSLCGTPYLVLADTQDASYYRNDRTGIAYKFDSMTIELEDSNGDLHAAPGTAVTFPYQSDAVGYIIDWRQFTNESGLRQGCYKVVVNWSLEGNTGSFYYGSFLLREYNVMNAQGTVRIFAVLNDLVRKQGINYKDSGFGGTVRFKGQFGYMQPNYETENIVYTNRTREKVRNEAIRTYELRSNYLLSCQTRLIDEEFLLAANQIYISDHNFNNHVQEYYDFPVILSEDESPTFEYDDSIYAKVRAVFKEKVQVSESKYDGNIQGSANVILELPTVVTTPASCPDTSIEVNGVNQGSVVAGSLINVELSDSSGIVTPISVTKIGNGFYVVLPSDLALYAPYSSGDTSISFTVITGSAGTISSANTTGLTSVTYDINGSPATIPFSLIVGDVLTIAFDAAGADGVVILSGQYA